MVPRGVRLLAGLMAVSFLTVISIGVLAVSDARYRAEQRRATCERAVAVRDDHRAMWTWLAERFPGEQIVVDIVDQLNDRLPTLACVDDTPTPTPPET